jgi:mannose-6-phosphate isomerase-like protein (cupin superfamily)
MNPAFDDIAARPENQIFQVVFYPDRIYHAQYLNATRSARYEYLVDEVRTSSDVTVMKGRVKLNGAHLSHFIRIEYRASRLTEQSRQKGRLAQETVLGWMRLEHIDERFNAEANIRLHLCRWTDSWQVEFWETLRAPENHVHDIQILDQMGFEAPITSIPQFAGSLSDLKGLRRVHLAFREPERDGITGEVITDVMWDNNYLRSHQEPRDDAPSSHANTVPDGNYLVDFRRGFFVDARQVRPVRYRNAMMDDNNPERDSFGGPPDNVIEMRWLLQRELGAQLVFFHEVTIPAGKVEGTHQHIGSEELYYIVSGSGTAYMGEDDDPSLTHVPLVDRHIFGVGIKKCRELPVRAGHVIFTKSGGIHGIKSDSGGPLVFVAFLYHAS